MASFIDFVEWRDSNTDIYAWRYPETNLSTFTQLLVNESQEAILIGKGRIIGKFGPGRHTLTTENLPIISELYGLPFGKKNPFTAEVWFVNKRIPLNLDWNISNMLVVDPQFKWIPLRAKGRYGLKIVDSEKFLVKLVGNLTSFSSKGLTDHFQGILEQKTKSIISSYMQANCISVTQIQANLNDIANALQLDMEGFWADYGFSLPGFYVTNIEIDDTTQQGRAIIDSIARGSQQSVEGYTWQQQKFADISKAAVQNPGDMGIMGMAMLAGGFGGMGAFGSQVMQQPPGYAQNMTGQPPMGFGGAPNQQMPQSQMQTRKRQTVFCSNCGKSFPTTSRFCPHCGNQYRPCPVCQSDNSEKAKRCVSCGAALNMSRSGMLQDAGLECPSCGSPLPMNTKFCPNCGHKVE